MRKRMLGLVLVFCMFAAFIPCVNAENAVASGDCGAKGSNVTWTLDSSGVLTISGVGAIANYVAVEDGVTYPDQPWKEYKSKIEEVVIEQGVTEVGYYAFWNCYNLKKVTLPEGLTNLAWRAFVGCRSLQNMTLPQGLTRIGDAVFSGCSSITNINIPENVTFIDVKAFEGTQITNINIPKNVSYIGSCAFNGCTKLSEITVDPENEYYMSENGFLFSKDKTTLLYYPKTRTNTSYIVPDGVTNIYGGAFQACTFLQSVELPDSVNIMGSHVFYGCTNLKNVSIPYGIKKIFNYTFYECTSLRNINIPSSVETISFSAFDGCTSLKSIYIPQYVFTIDSYAFNRCDALQDVYYGGSESWWNQLLEDIGSKNDSLINANIYYNSEPHEPEPDVPAHPLYTITGNTTIFHVPVSINPGNIEVSVYDRDGNLKGTSGEFRFESVGENGRVDTTVPCPLKVGDRIRINVRNRIGY